MIPGTDYNTIAIIGMGVTALFVTYALIAVQFMNHPGQLFWPRYSVREVYRSAEFTTYFWRRLNALVHWENVYDGCKFAELRDLWQPEGEQIITPK